MNEHVISVVGRLGSEPTLKSVNGDRVAEFRFGSKARRKDGETWVDGHTNWFAVEAWGDFAQHVVASLRKGDLVVVVGKLKIEQWESGERRGTSVKIRADHIGLSLRTGAVSKDRRQREQEEPLDRAPEREPDARPSGAMDASGWALAGVAGDDAPAGDAVLQGAAAGGQAWTAPPAEADAPF